MRRRKRASPDIDFKTEEELCSAFIEALPTGWTVYPETGEWDILLVRSGPDLGPVRSGDQIGIQAKLRANLDVIGQAVTTPTSPSYRSVLVPDCGRSYFRTVCQMLRLGIFYPIRGEWHFRPDRMARELGERWGDSTVRLPPVVPDLPAGVPSPRQLTKWRIGALRLCTLLRRRGYLTKADFRTHAIDIRRWTHRGHWLIPGPEKGTLIARAGAVLPDVGWEAVAAKIAEKDAEEERPPDPPRTPRVRVDSDSGCLDDPSLPVGSSQQARTERTMSQAIDLFKESLEFGAYRDYAAAKRSIAGMLLTPDERAEALRLAQKEFGVKDDPAAPPEPKRGRAKKAPEAAPEKEAKSDVEQAAEVAQRAVAVSTKLPPGEARKVAAEGSRVFHLAMEQLSQSPTGLAAVRRMER